ncbi:MAG: glycerophosphodiester phosphodiesterase [Anaerolineales bacterium]|nr:glycerophosphodiester phosphodiesterase [Anaerolineales bacterium]
MSIRTEWYTDAPLVIAHRGASAYAPENTIASFKAAIELNAQAVEMDVMLTKDKQIIVHHDRTLDRTTNGEGPVSSWNLNEIKRLDAGSHFSQDFTYEVVPTVEEVLSELGNTVLINIELKNNIIPDGKLSKDVIGLVKQYQLEHHVLISSFNPWDLWQCRGIDPDLPLALLLHQNQPRLFRNLFIRMTDPDFLHPEESIVNSQLIEEFHRKGIHVNAWTIDDKDRMEQLFIMGINGLITNVPDIAVDVLRGNNE